jgi:small-conductance mechanosensitive channel
VSKQIETQLEVQLEGRNRLTALFRPVLIIPAYIFLTAFSNWASDENDIATWTIGFLFFPAFLAIVFRGIYPSYVLTFNKALLDLSLRFTSYLVLLTDKYPSIESNETVKTTFPDVDGGKALNRLLPLVKWILSIPLYLLGVLYTLYAGLFVVFAWLSIVITGTMPTQAADVICKVIAYWNRVTGYAFLLVTDEYPSFKL